MRESAGRVAIVAAHNEAEQIGETLDALRGALAGARLIVADDASGDGTAETAMGRGAWVIRRGRPHGKGGNVTAAAQAAISEFPGESTVLLCDADLGESAGRLVGLIEAVESEECDLAVARFAQTTAGGLGLVLGYARRGVERRTGARLAAPLSGQRAMRLETLGKLLPFAAGWGMESAMTVDAIRAGLRVEEVKLPLEHRVTRRTPSGFLHRAGQLRDIRRALRAR
jgi:glycosyltransferase involved in cell wall biosynthesis